MVPNLRSTKSLTIPDPPMPPSPTSVRFDAVAKLRTPCGSSLPRIVSAADAAAASMRARPEAVTPDVETELSSTTYSSFTSGKSSVRTETLNTWVDEP